MIHQQMAKGKWFAMPFVNQMANIGSEIERTIIWQSKKPEYSQMAFDRALELLDLTVSDNKNQSKLKELLRLRETLVDHFMFNNRYASTDKSYQDYFYIFNYAARLGL
jgi:hypothetical protein